MPSMVPVEDVWLLRKLNGFRRPTSTLSLPQARSAVDIPGRARGSKSYRDHSSSAASLGRCERFVQPLTIHGDLNTGAFLL
jgi:hypothetical protein